ncbi:hypothetical protein Nhal_3679 [Nitrosococcus halophilus Nc 4]|uniref:Uncharacterized protein n=1 Tax=Nitrosococcus halophilus (strain Nc4) TaxID=472759 RepID=D5C2M4_NITHN|nr:hypothetical protein [Nitrosococcus halophilus]ADE16699.1 hypothetical protein Nhal_3679 [Nitrosococcus halophilus Nc 4]
MKLFNLKRSALAVTAAVGGALLAPQAGAVNIATDGIGEVAIAPYYTVRDGWLTTVNLINTQNVPIIVKVRIHEGRNSRDVLDFNVALSSFDVFTGVLKEASDGSGPVFVATDQENADGLKTCTIPSAVGGGAEIPLSPLAFGPAGTRNDDGGPTGSTPTLANPTGLTPEAAERMREGYVEFIVMGHADMGTAQDPSTFPLPLDPIEDVIESHDCATLETAFSRANILATARQFGEPINALKFNFTLLNPSRGVEAGNTATTWANFYNPGASAVDAIIDPADNVGCTITRGDERSQIDNWVPDASDAGASCRNLITAQVAFDFLEPSLNDAFPQTANWWDDGLNLPIMAMPLNTTNAHPPENLRGVDALSLTIQRSGIVNEWSNNPALGVTTDWIVTLPTKGFYVDGSETLTQGSANDGVTKFGNQGPGVQSAIIPSGVVDTANTHNRPETILGVGDDIPYAPFANAFGQTIETDRTSATACNEVQTAVFDRAEQRTFEEDAEEVVVSPAPPPVVESQQLCYETNVITFNGQSALDSIYPLLDTDGLPTTVSTATLPAPGNTAGWMRLDLVPTNPQLSGQGDQGGLPSNVADHRGLPVTGFMLKQRTFGDVTRNFASSTDHAYLRDNDNLVLQN